MATVTSTDAPQGGVVEGHGATNAGRMEEFSYDDSIVRMFATATIVWAIVATLAGLLVAVLLILPGLAGGSQYFSFARLRPLHTNAAIFAFAGNAIFAAVYYSTQRLCKARMWSDALSRMHFWGWQLIIVLAAITLPLGITQSKEYAELQWPIDILIAVVWLFIFGGNFLMTLIHRRERHMYVALWFYIATIVTVALLHVFNNLVVPIGWFASIPVYAGVQDAFMQWWYGHNAVAFFLTTPFLGLMYYFLPKAAERPVFSYRLSIIHFWSLVFIYIWAGPHHLHYTSLPEWASTLGMLFSLMLWMPSWGGMINGLLTLRGAWHKVAADPVLKFFVVGVTFYGMSTFEGPMLSVKAINAFTHYTDWTIAHVHSGALGWNGFMAFGMLYWMLPRIFQTKIWSDKLVSLHFWIGTLGILLYIIPIYAAGLMQGWMWRAMDDTGHLMYPDFVETTQSIVPLWWLRVVGGLLYVSGTLMLGVNALMTWMNRPSEYEVPVISAPRLSKEYNVTEPKAKSHLEGAPVLDLSKKLDIFGRMGWHRSWERLPVKFTVLTTLAVIVATLFEAIPTFLIRTNVPTIATVKPYTPLELAGRHIFVSEGCYNCHSQMIRPMVSETKRYGEYSKPGESIYDRPFQWGSRRIGPDLAREGGKQSSFWHWTHFENPENVSPGSVMPSYEHLLTEDLKYDAIAPHVQAAAYLGAEYSEADLNDTANVAMAQAERIAAEIVEQGGPAKTYEKQAVALIAYLQRIGIDLFAEETPAEAVPAETAPEGEAAPTDEPAEVAMNHANGSQID
ncbi:cytochrome-c oxidase, cbb3-type subunit I [Aporhodopirellula aestuarii]|uniref:cytochrome-c oxidase n=1 Tax=Aporhodopirellula aestuarii TaxID=2950107 RepID=A0ABT0UG23_9BACT|nr:cytochrome-c oxidase, cbb3-type subunit I [Aporhodopirellula aestuarii]MCM2375205.1 cytochrome-c oxidase, cbb3-type subunit I [Aporhodopirellula aestuarii]